MVGRVEEPSEWEIKAAIERERDLKYQDIQNQRRCLDSIEGLRLRLLRDHNPEDFVLIKSDELDALLQLVERLASLNQLGKF